MSSQNYLGVTPDPMSRVNTQGVASRCENQNQFDTNVYDRFTISINY